MRVTQSMYYKSLYGSNNTQLNTKLFDVNKQIASGLKIQYAHDDVATFAETMRFDNEINILGQIQKSTESGYKVSNQTDTILNEFDTTMTRTRTLILQAANASQSVDSQDAIAAELRGLESHFINLANTSINGEFLFAGSAVDTKPITKDGLYVGNDVSMNSFLGSGVQQQYNLSGADLFLGEESLVKRKVTTNIPLYSLTAEYPDFTDPSISGEEVIISEESTIRDLMGDNDTDIGNSLINHFYISGSKSNGNAFSEHITMNGTETVGDLLTKIGDAYGNSPSLNVVNVSLNQVGQIVIEDKLSGSSKLEFHMTGAVDYDQTAVLDSGDVNNATVYVGTLGEISNLKDGETNFESIINGSSTVLNPNLFVKSFVKSPYTVTDTSISSDINTIVYDQTHFTKDGATLSSTTPQVLKTDNSFAKDATKISEVADLSQGTVDTLDGTQFKLVGTNINNIAFDVQVDFATAGSTFSLDGGVTNYDIFDASSPRAAIAADDMTYRQLMDVVNMVVTDKLPLGTLEGDYDTAIAESEVLGNTYLTYDGKIGFRELNATTTDTTISLYDANAGKFDDTTSSIMTFNSNNALTINDPKTDFFKSLDEVISSIEEHKLFPDGSTGELRNVGMENAIAVLDDLQTHLMRTHAMVGAHSNTLSRSLERTSILEISTMTLRSSVIDTDLAEAALTLTQLTLNYEAMLSTVGKISKLSLVNYL